MKDIVSKLFYSLGAICSVRQWEVIFCILTKTVGMISFIDWEIEKNHHEFSDMQISDVSGEYFGLFVVTLTILRMSAVLYTYKQFNTIYQLGSNFILGLSVVFLVLSSFIFTGSVMFLLNVNMTELRDSFFIFFLIINLEKASYLSRCALKSSSYIDVKKNIAEGISHIGPSFTLDTIYSALLIWIVTLSGNTRWAQLSQFGVLAIIVNYISILTIHPACISLALEYSVRCSSSQPPWLRQRSPHRLESTTFNPVIQGVKKIMSAGLFTVHVIKMYSEPIDVHSTLKLNEPPTIVRWINSEVENIILFVTIIMLVAWYEMRRSTEDLSKMDKQKGLSKINEQKEMNSTPMVSTQAEVEEIQESNREPRPVEECLKIKSQDGIELLTDEEIGILLLKGSLGQRALEIELKDDLRVVKIRREFVKHRISDSCAIKDLPYLNYDYSKVKGRCCENVIGYVPLPVGVAGPLTVDGMKYIIPLATTEGALVASTNRGCKALSQALSGGVSAQVYNDGMTRAPMVQLPSAMRVVEVMKWMKLSDNFNILKEAFDANSGHVRLTEIQPTIASRKLFIRFVATTGDAMGMNMTSKGAEAALLVLQDHFEDIEVLSISGNLCTDKKHSAVNWIRGRGKSVVCEAVVPGDVVKSVLKTQVSKLIGNNKDKNLIGSAMAGSVGGNNAHAANIVAAIFIACGQDPAQVVESSSCLTDMEAVGEDKEDLYISVTMPALCVGTVGGGTCLPAQQACLRMLNVQGPSPVVGGEHARTFAKIVAATVMAGELSLMASLAEQTLVKSHMNLNRAKV